MELRITYATPPLGHSVTRSLVTENDVPAWIEHALKSGVIELDPYGSCWTSELYAMYLETSTARRTLNFFGRQLTKLGSPALRSTNGRRRRGGIKIIR